MPAVTTAYLVIRRDDGFGDVFALVPGQRFTLGRANTNRIILKDEQCSREHAEVYYADGRWCLRDLNSLNGTRINNDALQPYLNNQIDQKAALDRAQVPVRDFMTHQIQKAGNDEDIFVFTDAAKQPRPCVIFLGGE